MNFSTFQMSLVSSLLMAALGVNSAQGAWLLDTKVSSLSFNSVKNARVVESHGFESMQGSVSGGGAARVSIDLASVETMIPIRNERMATLLFDTVKFPVATLTAQVPLAAIRRLPPGGAYITPLALQLSLHGKVQKLVAEVLVTRINHDDYQVSSQKPVIIVAGMFDLDAGIAALRSIAGLDAIISQVPVSFNLVFRAEPGP